MLAIGTKGNMVNPKRERQRNQSLQEAGLQIDFPDCVGPLVIDVDVSAVRSAVLVPVIGAAKRNLVQVDTHIDVPIGSHAWKPYHGHLAIQPAGVIHDHRIMEHRVRLLLRRVLP